jgi:acetyl-CoA carboxylase biotin carboxyl carrier protein
MDIKDLKLIVKMITETDITEFELQSGEEKLCLRRGTAVPMQAYASPVLQTAVLAPQASAFSVTAGTPTTLETVATPVEEGTAITSPIVGTFYRAPAPDAAPYVEVGQVVEKGQVFCIVEAMKLMNEIEAEFRCKVVKICKENAQPVEFSDTLFMVEPL